MVWDGFVPSCVDELRDIFYRRKFPCCFDFLCDKRRHEYKGVVVDRGVQDPGFLENYKISHVLDAGENFLMEDGSVLGDTDLSPKYYPIGHSSDFLREPDKIRKMVISPESKKIIVAKFLRFIHPLNFFLTPSTKLHTCSTKVYRKDIGEDPVMIYLVKQHLKEKYETEYKEFLERALWVDGYIGIKYWPKKIKSKKKPHRPLL